MLEAAWRDKPVSAIKASISAEIIKSIIGKFAGPSANLKDIRVVCICSLLVFARLFRYDELRARSFEIFQNKNIFRNIFRLFCSWKQNNRNGNPGIPE